MLETNSQTTDAQIVISFDHNLKDKLGHDWIYQECLQAAAISHGLSFKLVISTDATDYPPSAIRSIYSPVRAPRGYLKIFVYYILTIRSLITSITSLVSRSTHAYIVVQSFSDRFLLSLSLAIMVLYLRGYNLRPIIVLRYPLNRKKNKIRMYSLYILRYFSKKLSLRSDTDLLVDHNSEVLNFSVKLIPIPHIEKNLLDIKFDKKIYGTDILQCWWPGAPRPAKGIHLIRELVALPNGSGKISLLASKSSELAKWRNSSSLNVLYCNDILDREDYIQSMRSADVILLPYDENEYKFNSSGIFVEAICAGKIVLSSGGTWIAYELEKYGLDAFVISMDPKAWMHRLLEISKEKNTADLFSAIREDYRKFHNRDQFERIIFEH